MAWVLRLSLLCVGESHAFFAFLLANISPFLFVVSGSHEACHYRSLSFATRTGPVLVLLRLGRGVVT